MQCDPGVLGKSTPDVVVFVGGVVVTDDMQFHAGMGLGDQFEEVEELDVGVAGSGRRR